MMVVKMILENKVGIAGIFFQAQININKIGRSAHQEIEKLWFKVAIVLLILVKSMCPLLPKIVNKIREPKKAGIVDHIIFLMWANNSLSATALDRLVESESGDILSPNTAPETIAPAIKARFWPIDAPIPKKAIPIVEIVVKPEPIDRKSVV